MNLFFQVPHPTFLPRFDNERTIWKIMFPHRPFKKNSSSACLQHRMLLHKTALFWHLTLGKDAGKVTKLPRKKQMWQKLPWASRFGKRRMKHHHFRHHRRHHHFHSRPRPCNLSCRTCELKSRILVRAEIFTKHLRHFYHQCCILPTIFSWFLS